MVTTLAIYTILYNKLSRGWSEGGRERVASYIIILATPPPRYNGDYAEYWIHSLYHKQLILKNNSEPVCIYNPLTIPSLATPLQRILDQPLLSEGKIDWRNVALILICVRCTHQVQPVYTCAVHPSMQGDMTCGLATACMLIKCSTWRVMKPHPAQTYPFI